MIHEVALFWGLIASFLIADNFLLLPRGSDYLNFGRAGHFNYKPSGRIEARGRDLVFLNPLNLFDRAVLTDSTIGPLNISQYRIARRMLQAAVPRLNAFALLGYTYIFAVVLLAVASFRIGFEPVLVAFIACHAMFWILSTSLLVAWRHSLSLSKTQTFGYAAEAFFVPAYTMNLSKRLWFKHSLNLPALVLGLHQLKSTQDESYRELYSYQLGKRLDDLEADMGLMEPDIEDSADAGAGSAIPINSRSKATLVALKWIKEAKGCLIS